MHPDPRKIVPVVVLAGLAVAFIYYLSATSSAQAGGPLTASGTVEAVEIDLAAEISGRVTEVLAREGDGVEAGEVLVRLDDSALQAQLAQAEAALAVAEANYDLVAAGVPAEQAAAAVAAAEAELLFARAALDALIDTWPDRVAQAQQALVAARQRHHIAGQTLDALPETGDDFTVSQAEAELSIAAVLLERAQAAYDRLAAGPDPDEVARLEAASSAAEARLAAAGLETPAPEQLAVAAAQVEAARAAVAVLETQIAKTEIRAPIDGVVLERLVEPGEIALPNAPLLLLADLGSLTLTVYAPEDRYGEIVLGQEAPVTVDSFPDTRFTAEVVHIAGKAEFTPRNVQTQEGRRTTVFAVRLEFDAVDGRLKPGMPADVVFEAP
ncbi:MAG TPA: efflux RND transporter periplasmic adaptor subunit [Anaerolineales bacterium]|nr:efflux RND transporter periplasmic adaptor subunit [Anaerolineales bacterium]